MNIRIMTAVFALLPSAALFANVVITDVKPEPSNVTVPAGEELEIRGGGLTADCSVTLEGGNAVRFYADAEVAARLTANGEVTLAAESGVKGVFTGGASLKKTTMLTGDITVRAKNFDLSGTTYVKGGHLTVADAAWRVLTNESNFNINQAQTENACFEVAGNGVLELCSPGGNQFVSVGGGSAFESKLLLNGGKFLHGFDAFNVSSANGGRGVFEIVNGGVFQTYGGIRCTGGNAEFVFGDAVFDFLTGSYSQAKYPFSGEGSAEVTLKGEFTLNVASRAADYADHPDGRVSWRAESGARLRLKGRTDGTDGFSLHNFAAGATLDVSAVPTKVRLVDATSPVRLVKAEGSSVLSTGTSPRLIADCVYTTAQSLGRKIAVEGAEGFSEVTLSNLVFRVPDGQSSYVGALPLSSIAGKLYLEEGSLLLDAEPGTEKFEKKDAASVVYQDSEDAVVLTRESGWFGPTSPWKNADGNAVQWQPGAVGRVLLPESNTRIDANFSMSGLRVAGEGANYFEGGTGVFSLGGNGLKFESSRKIGFASGSFIPRLTLGADQTWTNLAASGRAELYFGMDYSWPNYCKTFIAAEDGVTDWKLTGELEVWLMNASNDLRGVSVSVCNPAALHLENLLDARLNASALVLDGSEMTFAQSYAGKMEYGSRTLVTQPAVDAAHLAPSVTLKNGARLCVASGVSPFAVPSVTSVGANFVSGSSLTVTQSLTRINIASAADSLVFELPVTVSAPDSTLEVSGSGLLSLCLPDGILETDVTFSDSGTLCLTGEGVFLGDISGAGGLEIAADGIVDLRGRLDGFKGGEIVVSSGTLVLENAAAIPAGVKVKTEGDGALQLVDPAGFDPQAGMDGTRNLALPGRLVVTDVARTGEELVVGPGETIEIYGSGLDASSSVVLRSGSTVRFRRTATIAARVSVPSTESATADVIITADRGAVGTIAQAYCSQAQGYLHTVVEGEGQVVFADGITLAGYNRLKLRGGNALVSGGTVESRQKIYMFSGELAFTNSVMSFEGTGSSFELASEEQCGDARVVFRAGSSWNMGNNCIPSIGRVAGFESRLVLDGGTWTTATYDPIYLCQYGTGTGILEIKSGRFATNRRIVAGQGGVSKFIWSGGTYAGIANDYNFRFANLIEGPLTELLIDGDCRLELSRFMQSAVSNFSHGASVMRATPGSRLTVVSEDTTPGWCNRLVLRGFEGDGLCLNLVASGVNGAPMVEIADAEGPVSLTWQTGGEGSVRAVGTSPELKANFLVPAGTRFDNSMTAGWHEGFSAVELVDLKFEEGATYVLQSDGTGIDPLVLTGRLTLPETLFWSVDRTQGAMPAGRGFVAAEAAGGIFGGCEWTRRGIGRSYSIEAQGNRLIVDMIPVGMSVIIR